MGKSQNELDWIEGQPVSRAYGDVYFSRASGLEETRHVFLQHNRLEERWRKLECGSFTIAETGFGTALNFLCAWQLWRQCAPIGSRLHFISTEQFPLSHADMQRALGLWPELDEEARALLAQYRWLVPGWQQLLFDDGSVTLTLLIGDARQTLPGMVAKVDAWFLDGFAPAKNPEMWQPELLNEVARLAAPGCTFATFTSAGTVRRGLEAAGFRVKKVPGFGSKREMLCGERLIVRPEAKRVMRNAIVIGGGLAGTATARSLARRGWQVTLIERHAGLAAEASGNPQGILYPRLSGHDIPLSRIALAGYLLSLRLLETLLPKGHDWDACGLLQLGFDAREVKRCHEIAQRYLGEDILRPVDVQEASLIAGIPLEHGGLWFPAGGWVHPPALCRALADHANITTLTAHEAMHLQHIEGGWQVMGKEGCLVGAPVVVVCAANESQRLVQTAHLPLEAVRGQITCIPATPASLRLQTAICTEGYVSPAREGAHCVGATFSPEDGDAAIRSADHAENLATLANLSPALYQALNGARLDIAALQGRAAVRCVTPDYLPMVGPLLDATRTVERYTPGSRLPAEHLPWLHGLHVNTGHGSKGLLTAPLCAELLASLLEGEPLPVDRQLAQALDPNRFLLRARGLKRLIGTAIG